MSGGGGKKAGAQGSQALEGFLEEFRQQSGPTREALFGQTLEALRTGGVGARLPIIQQSVEASRSATSQALQGLDERLARTGLAGTPFGERARAEVEQRGQLATSGIPTDIAQQLIAQAGGLSLGSVQTLTGGLGQLASTGAQRESAEQDLFASLFNTAVGAFGRGG